jgi:hypothetical protein
LIPKIVRQIVSTALLLAIALLTAGCTSTRTISENVETGVHKLKLKAGVTVRIVTINRERLFLEITQIQGQGFKARDLDWRGKKTTSGDIVFIEYSDLALIQEEHFSSAGTAGVVASITLIGAMVAAVSVGVPPVMPPP